VREFLEKTWTADLSTEGAIKLAVRSLLEVVQTGAKNIDLAIVEGYGKVRNLTLAELEDVVKEIEAEKAEGASMPSVLPSWLTQKISCRGGKEEVQVRQVDF
jgi:hypothetical protein